MHSLDQRPRPALHHKSPNQSPNHAITTSPNHHLIN
jgi:hypothetical protein